MSLKPEHSLGASLAVMALDFGIFQLNLPTTADVKATSPHNSQIGSSTNAAAWTAISASAALSLVTRDANIFIFGAGFAVVLTYMYKHANLVSPTTGMVTMPPASGTSSNAS